MTIQPLTNIIIDTIYRYIRSGKLAVSCLGRSYRIPKRNLDLLLWESRTQELPLREDH